MRPLFLLSRRFVKIKVFVSGLVVIVPIVDRSIAVVVVVREELTGAESEANKRETESSEERERERKREKRGNNALVSVAFLVGKYKERDFHLSSVVVTSNIHKLYQLPR